MSIIKANTWQNPDGTENYKCRAWVNFNGTGTVAIRASGNVSSITDNNTGDYTVNFANALPDANYAVAFGSPVAASAGSNYQQGIHVTGSNIADSATLKTTTALRIGGRSSSGTTADTQEINIAIFR